VLLDAFACRLPVSQMAVDLILLAACPIMRFGPALHSAKTPNAWKGRPSMETETILPALKPHDWKGRESVACRPLLAGEGEARMPLVAFGYDRPHTFEFLPAKDLPGGNTPENLAQVEAAAVNNLRKRPGAWHVERVEVGGDTLAIAICTDDFLAAERVLDKAFMMEAHRLLEGETLVAGIPRRGALLATKMEQPRELIGRFAGAVSAQFHRGDSPPISPLLFAVQGGVVVGYGKGAEDSGKAAAQEGEADIFISDRVMVVKEANSDRTFIEFVAGGKDLEGLARRVQDAILQVAAHYREDEKFGGQIHVRFVPDLTPEAEMRRAMPSIEAHYNGVLREAGVKTAGGEPVEVQLRYGMD
jgi:uncharacterized protein YtpQ (UPF0354 family)